MQDDITQLRADCELANKLWGRTFSALGAMTFREKGEEATKKLWISLLSSHQQGHFLEGLRKLGIRDDEPPAVKAAKYHYLTNQIGGLRMEYVEESPRKVWIRYMAPMWTYAGVTMMAMPPGVRRVSSSGWHGKNGELLGCPRLQYVRTKVIMECDPYDEGYFIENDHDIPAGQGMRWETVNKSPEFDPAKAPVLDPVLWPEARKLKARRNWSRGYVRTTVETLLTMFGEHMTHFLFSQVQRGMAIQFTHELLKDCGIDGKDPKSIGSFFMRLEQACGQDVQMSESGGVVRIVKRTHLPWGRDASDGLRASMFEFQKMATRQINGRVSINRLPDGEVDVWEIRDEGRWLW